MCLEEHWICTVQELENMAIADIMAVQWTHSDMCSFLSFVSQFMDGTYDRDTSLSGSSTPPTADVLSLLECVGQWVQQPTSQPNQARQKRNGPLKKDSKFLPCSTRFLVLCHGPLDQRTGAF